MAAVRGLIKEEDVAAVRDRTDIVALVERYVTLRRSGSTLKGLCPFHDEKTPSFHVNPSRVSWTCFGCGEGGDAIAFLREVEGLSFVEAVERLADEAGVTLRYEDGKTGPSREERERARSRKKRLLTVLADAHSFYTGLLGDGAAKLAQDYLTGHGFTPEHARRFDLGFAPNSWDATTTFLAGRGHTMDDIVASGMGVRRDSGGVIDRFRGRLMFPISDISGTVIGFGARHLYPNDKGPKYLNSPETPLYRKTNVLYGLDRARKAISRNRQVVVMEGYTDVMAAHLSGIETAVAACGTAFGADHVHLLRRLLGDQPGATGQVVYMFDGDNAGKKAAKRAYELEDNFLTHSFAAIEPTGKDPCDLWLASGPDGLKALLDSKVPLFEHVLRTELDGLDLSTVAGRMDALTAVAPILGRIGDFEARRAYARTVAGWIGVDAQTVFQSTRAPRDNTNHPPPPAAPETPDPDSTAPTRTAPQPPDPSQHRDDHRLLQALAQHPALSGKVAALVAADTFTHPIYATAFATLRDAVTASAGNPAHLVPSVVSRAPDPVVRRILTGMITTAGDGPALTGPDVIDRAYALAETAAENTVTALKIAAADPALTPTEQAAAADALDGAATRRRDLAQRRLQHRRDSRHD